MYVGIGAGLLALAAALMCWLNPARRRGTAGEKKPSEIADKQKGDTWLNHASDVVDDLNLNNVQKIKAEPEAEMFPMGDVMGRAATYRPPYIPPKPNFQLKMIDLDEPVMGQGKGPPKIAWQNAIDFDEI